jgi:hypothetical protein
MSSEWKSYFAKRSKEKALEEQLKGTYRGYYLVRESDGLRFFISPYEDIEALDKVAEDVLSAGDYAYWIDYSLGIDVEGKPAWMNMDYTNKFF